MYNYFKDLFFLISMDIEKYLVTEWITIKNSSNECSPKQVPKSIKSKQPKYRNSSHTVDAFVVLHELRKYVISDFIC